MKTFYEQIGGEAGVSALVNAFLKALEKERSAPLRACYREDLSYYPCRMTAFLSGWLGGPMRYPGRFGLPMIVEKHRAFPVNRELALLWLECMRDALRETGAGRVPAPFARRRLLADGGSPAAGERHQRLSSRLSH